MKQVFKRVALHGLRVVSDVNRDFMLRRKIARILREQRGAPAVLSPSPPGSRFDASLWRKAYVRANGIDSVHYVSETLFYNVIEPYLNNLDYISFFSDKNNLDRLAFDWPLPRTLGRIMRGRFLGPDYAPADPHAVFGDGSVVVKPSLIGESGGGKSVQLMSAADAAAFAARECARLRPVECLFQAPVTQSAQMARFNAASVNTLRIMTMLDADGPRLVSGVLRMGRAGSFVDNLAAGGVACGVRDGRLVARGFDGTFRAYEAHPDTGVVFADAEIVGWTKAVALALRLQARLPDIALISWDIAIDEAGEPVVIEFNSRFQEINAHQLANGPLFGDRLEALAAAADAGRLLGATTSCGRSQRTPRFRMADVPAAHDA